MFNVHILGTSSAIPAFSRHPSAQVVEFNDRYYLVDCGEGTQIQFQKYKIKYARLDGIFISHLHGDHFLGLPGLLASLNIYERTRPLPIFAPRGLQEIIKVIYSFSETYLRYEVEFHALEDYEPGDTIFEIDKLKVSTIPLSHRTLCRGFLFKEQNKRRKFNFYKAKELGIPNQYFHLLKQGNDITLPDGRKLTSDQVLFPVEKTMAYAYCSDTSYQEEIVPFIEGSTLLYHEATFLSNMKKRAAATHHSTAEEAAKIAAQAKVNQLLIGHYSARYKDLNPLLEEARSIFPATELALEGKVFDIKSYV